MVNATASRLEVQGFDAGADRDLATRAWELFVSSGLDALQGTLFRAALVSGRAYVTADPSNQAIAIESPTQVIVRTHPSTHERLAALKLYLDADDRAVATLYLPGSVSTWRTEGKLLSARPTCRAPSGARRPTRTTRSASCPCSRW